MNKLGLHCFLPCMYLSLWTCQNKYIKNIRIWFGNRHPVVLFEFEFYYLNVNLSFLCVFEQSNLKGDGNTPENANCSPIKQAICASYPKISVFESSQYPIWCPISLHNKSEEHLSFFLLTWHDLISLRPIRTCRVL